MRQLLTLALAALLGLASATTVAQKKVLDMEQGKTGLINLKHGDDMFYWFFNSRRDPSSDPLVLWLTGGPGCASEVALFFENGPFGLNKDQTLKYNPYSWNNVSNLLYFDNPIGTGFSKAAPGDLNKNEDQIAHNVYEALLGFVQANPEFKNREFFITGESYAGHYIPAIAYYLTNNVTDLPLNFKGIAIGNGWTDPIVQYPQYAEFAHENNLIDDSKYQRLQSSFKRCQNLIKAGEKSIAFEYCSILMNSILGNPPKFNVYDIRKPCSYPPLCYDFSASDKYLNTPSVQEKLGVSGRKWVECSNPVHSALLGDWINNFAPKISNVVEKGLEVLVYSGDKDFICNWRGGEAWTNAVQWSGQTDFNNAKYNTWNVNGQAAGALKQVKNFSFLRVFNAGHMVPMDQPANALQMLNEFIVNKIKEQPKAKAFTQ